MGEKNYAVLVAIPVEYSTDNFKSGETVTMEIFDESLAKDAINFPDVPMVERGTLAIYDASFTPDAEGEWLVLCSSAGGKGKRIKKYSVGGYNLDGVGQKIDTLDTQLDTVETKIDGLDSPAMIG